MINKKLINYFLTYKYLYIPVYVTGNKDKIISK
jgi:hypothetical protein